VTISCNSEELDWPTENPKFLIFVDNSSELWLGFVILELVLDQSCIFWKFLEISRDTLVGISLLGCPSIIETHSLGIGKNLEILGFEVDTLILYTNLQQTLN
jgi:hypothetical protein